jgi:hypothetical protein
MAPAGASQCYRDLSAILEKYISPLLVHSTLRSALNHQRTSPGAFERKHITGVVEHAMIGMRLFCDPARLPDLMIELAEHCARTQA